MDWIPEPKPPSGGLAAEGFYKLLGRPRLDPLTVLVRETAQNSWDARQRNAKSVKFGLHSWQLTNAERKALATDVFVEAAQVKGTTLAEHLASEDLIGLFITDRNTKGLGGPLQADQENAEGIYDWVDFVLNVGETNTQGHTGGTYGFGKTISYVVSQVNSVVIHSRTLHRGKIQTRLIACALGERFSKRNKLYTGRHWWGEAGDGVPLPATGRDADRIARAIGMPAFDRDEVGTNILVLAPDFGGREPGQAMRFIAESVTWHLWPKLMRRNGKQDMCVDMTWNGEPVPIPKPQDRPPLHGFAQAFQAILDEDTEAATPGLRLDTIRCRRPIVDVGILATVPLVHRERAEVDDGSDSDDPEAPKPAAAITGVCHHVALLRTPELVVDYLEGPPPPEGGTEWAGVFRARDGVDGHFAAAEPPTHDSWNPELLPKSQGRTIVNVGLREIHTALDNRWASRRKPSHEEVSSTALIADELGHLLGPIDGRGRGKRRRESPPPSPGMAKPKIDFVFSAPVEIAEDFGTKTRLRVRPAAGSSGTRLAVKVAAALDGSSADAELDPLLALIGATIDGESMKISGLGGVFELSFDHEVEVELVARRGLETTVLFDVEAESVP